eukprot:3678499-Prymnesium_polylepis.1
MGGWVGWGGHSARARVTVGLECAMMRAACSLVARPAGPRQRRGVWSGDGREGTGISQCDVSLGAPTRAWNRGEGARGPCGVGLER